MHVHAICGAAELYSRTHYYLCVCVCGVVVCVCVCLGVYACTLDAAFVII